MTWLSLFLAPLTALASYPIYEENVDSLQPELHSTEQKPSSVISKRDTPKKSAPLQSKKSRSRHRQHPDRPRVIYRDSEKKPQDLSKIEADAEDVEKERSTSQSEEWTDPENSPNKSEQ